MSEETFTYGLLGVVTAPVVLVTLFEGRLFGAGPTLCLILLVCSLLGLWRGLRRPRMPRARVSKGPS